MNVNRLKKYLKKALLAAVEVRNKVEEADCSRRLGNLFQDSGKHGMAEEYVQRSLAISKASGKIREEIAHYATLGNVYFHIVEYAKAEEYLETAIEESKKNGYREVEGAACEILGKVMFRFRGDYLKAKEYHENSLKISKELGLRREEAVDFGNLGNMYCFIGEYDKAEKFHSKALAIRKETGDKKGEATDYGNLGMVFLHLKEFGKSKEYFKKALLLSEKSGFCEVELNAHCNLTTLILFEGDVNGARSHLFSTVSKLEYMRSFLGDNDKFKLSFTDRHASCYLVLSALYCETGSRNEALSVVELGRARALSDLMATRYCLEKQRSVSPQTWIEIGKIMEKERNCTCLYISYYRQHLFLWILKAEKPILFDK